MGLWLSMFTKAVFWQKDGNGNMEYPSFSSSSTHLDYYKLLVKLPTEILIVASFASSLLHLKQIVSAVWEKYLGKEQTENMTL